MNDETTRECLESIKSWQWMMMFTAYTYLAVGVTVVVGITALVMGS